MGGKVIFCYLYLIYLYLVIALFPGGGDIIFLSFSFALRYFNGGGAFVLLTEIRPSRAQCPGKFLVKHINLHNLFVKFVNFFKDRVRWRTREPMRGVNSRRIKFALVVRTTPGVVGRNLTRLCVFVVFFFLDGNVRLAS